MKTTTRAEIAAEVTQSIAQHGCSDQRFRQLARRLSREDPTLVGDALLGCWATELQAEDEYGPQKFVARLLFVLNPPATLALEELLPGLNPWDRFGELRCWTDVGGGRWQGVGSLTPDMAWHRLRLVLDCQRQTTALVIDGLRYPSQFTGTPKPAGWGTEIAAGVQVEIISVYPGPDGSGAMHKADFRDWTWTWEAAGGCRMYAPLVSG